MRPEDVAIWERFLLKFPDEYEEVAYDVLVGSPPPFDTNIINGEPTDDVRLYKKKIDVVCYRDGVVDIIELKPRAGAGALGQVLGYVELYQRDIAPSPTPRAVLITDVERLDMRELAEKMRVVLIVV